MNLSYKVNPPASFNHHLLFRAVQGSDADIMLETYLRATQGIKERDIRVYRIDDSKPSIGIDDIRQLVLLSAQRYRYPEIFVVVIRSAQRMTEEAQNAILKLLEDSHENVLYLLSADNSKDLILTLTSRLFEVHFRPQENNHLNANQRRILQSLGYSGTSFDEYQQAGSVLRDNIETAKAWLAMSGSDRITRINNLEIPEIDRFLFCLSTIYFSLIAGLVERQPTEILLKVLGDLDYIQTTSRRILEGGNPRLNLTNLALCLR